MNITIQEVSKQDRAVISTCRTIFMNYFLHLYKDASPAMLGIKTELKDYLTNIFDRTEKALIDDPTLHACLAYSDYKVIGFATFGPLEDHSTILLRTMSVDLAYKDRELAIRNQFVQFIQQQLPNSQQIIIMVRKANSVHISFCLQAGFKQDNQIFNYSKYIKRTYDNNYNSYSYSFVVTNKTRIIA